MVHHIVLRAHLADLIRAAVSSLADNGRLPEAARSVAIEIQDVKQPEHGDYACNFALVAAKPCGLPPRQIAEVLKDALLTLSSRGDRARGGESSGLTNALDGVDIAGPGFLNFKLRPEYIASYVEVVLELGPDLPRTVYPDAAAPRHLNVEFVSVNPNGPITVGSGRGAAFGDTLCRVFEAAGHEPYREYYVNDGTNSEQMRRFAEALLTHYMLQTNPNLKRKIDELERNNPLDSWWKQTLDQFNQHLGHGFFGESPDWFSDRLDSFIVQSRALETLPDQKDRKLIKSTVFRESARVHYQFFDLPYKGDYVRDLALQLVEEHGGNARMRDLAWFQQVAMAKMIERQRRDLHLFGVEFDRWFSEQSMHDEGKVEAAIQKLLDRGDAYWADKQADEDEDPREELVREESEHPSPQISPPPSPSPRTLHRGEGVANAELYRGEEVSNAELHRGEGVANAESGAPLANPSEKVSSEPSAIPGKALWLRSTKYGDDKDRVIKRADGRWTYIASDIAYLEDKLTRELAGFTPTSNPGDRSQSPQGEGKEAPRQEERKGFDKAYMILGPDHHGYIGRMYACYQALGYPMTGPEQSKLETPSSKLSGQYEIRNPKSEIQSKLERPERLEIVIFQIVRFVKDGKPAPMRKRDGNIYELRDLIAELGRAVAPNDASPPHPDIPGLTEEQARIGRDVARYFYLMRSHETHMDFDIDLATKQSEENPVFYAQYAHARICSVLRKAAEMGVEGSGDRGSDLPSSFQASILSHPKELSLIKKIVDLPWEVERCAQDYGVHRLTTYATDLARAYHLFYDACRVIQPDQPELSQGRLALCEAAKIALKATFDLLGISAPERMEREAIVD